MTLSCVRIDIRIPTSLGMDTWKTTRYWFALFAIKDKCNLFFLLVLRLVQLVVNDRSLSMSKKWKQGNAGLSNHTLVCPVGWRGYDNI